MGQKEIIRRSEGVQNEVKRGCISWEEFRRRLDGGQEKVRRRSEGGHVNDREVVKQSSWEKVRRKSEGGKMVIKKFFGGVKSEVMKKQEEVKRRPKRRSEGWHQEGARKNSEGCQEERG